jgi:hypothetical protein
MTVLVDITPKELIAHVSRETGIGVELIMGSSIERRIAMARNMAMWLIRHLLPVTLKSVGSTFEVTVSAVSKACRRIDTLGLDARGRERVRDDRSREVREQLDRIIVLVRKDAGDGEGADAKAKTTAKSSG